MAFDALHEADRLPLATASGLVPLVLQLDQLGEARDQLRDAACLVIGQAAVGDGNRAIRLAIHMRQDNAFSSIARYPLGIGSTFQGLGNRREGMAGSNGAPSQRGSDVRVPTCCSKADHDTPDGSNAGAPAMVRRHWKKHCRT
jgi:hypothetical protein